MNQLLDQRVGEEQEAGSAPPADDPRVIEAVEEYLTLLEAGNPPDRQLFLQQHADIASVLDECLESLQFVYQLGPRLHLGEEKSLAHPALADGPEIMAPLGDFQILREIGRGGMGVVYEARQQSLDRRVALKVLPFAAALDPKHLQRFKNEAHTAAQLHHPGIVPVHAVGCERGVHFYAMEFIEGQSLASVIAELSQLPSGKTRESTGPSLPGATVADRITSRAAPGVTLCWQDRDHFFKWVARMGLMAAEALEVAHQLAVVHRDIKPANLLLDVQGQLWITDFGLALFANQPALTITGEVLGTLRYMSPEQAQGKPGLVDHRSDVYSLGASLYELATLRTVFEGQDRQELLGKIIHQEPLPPRQLDAGVPVDLETILLKSLAKGPNERYGTAQELADDLRRFLADQPVEARRPTWLERAGKWARRHRGLVASAVAALFLALAGLLTSTVLIAREQAHTQAALDGERWQAQEARDQRARAEESFRQARQAVEFLAQISEEELANLPHAQGVRRKLLETALVYFQDFIDKHEDNPSIQAELAQSHKRVSQILAELSVLQGSSQFLILANRNVQEDLQLSEPQRQQINQLAEKMSERWREAFGVFRKLSQEERRTKSLELARASEKPLADLLTPDQAKRFKQIVLQVQQRGPYGFSDPEVVQALNLTSKQKDKIRGILQDAYLAPWEGWFSEGGAPKKGMKKMPPTWKNTQEKIMAVLTAEQKDTWRDLTGAAVAGEVPLVLPGAVDNRFGPPAWLGPHPGPFGGQSGGFGPRKGKG